MSRVSTNPFRPAGLHQSEDPILRTPGVRFNGQGMWRSPGTVYLPLGSAWDALPACVTKDRSLVSPQLCSVAGSSR